MKEMPSHNPATESVTDRANTDAMSYRIRSIRRQKGLTLAQVASETSLDKGYLSRIERGEKTPSIATLIKIAEALGVQLGHLFGEAVQSDAITVVRRGEHKPFPGHEKASEHAYEAILSSDTNRRIGFFLVSPGNDPDFETADHSGEELIYVLRGRVEVSFVDRSVTLEEGDCVHFDGHIRHRIRRIGRSKAQLLVTVAQDLPGSARK